MYYINLFKLLSFSFSKFNEFKLFAVVNMVFNLYNYNLIFLYLDSKGDGHSIVTSATTTAKLSSNISYESSIETPK